MALSHDYSLDPQNGIITDNWKDAPKNQPG
jgi:hypothetical protein